MTKIKQLFIKKIKMNKQTKYKYNFYDIQRTMQCLKTEKTFNK